MVTDLVAATPEDDVLRRDIYDRPPLFKWTDGRVALLGDSAHAMQPNLGQGGCMAIEDAYELTSMIDERLSSNAVCPCRPFACYCSWIALQLQLDCQSIYALFRIESFH